MAAQADQYSYPCFENALGGKIVKFTLQRDPKNKTQKIPYAAMQIAGLANAE